MTSDNNRPTRSRLPAGVSASLPLLVPTAAVGVTFGILGDGVLGPIPTIVMSFVVWSGTAQFATLTTFMSGGSTGLASATGLMANLRYVPMGYAIAPDVKGGRLTRVLKSMVLTDGSFAVGHNTDGGFHVPTLMWAGLVQYVAWTLGTVTGVLGAGVVGDPYEWGLDVLFPVFYLSMLLPELRATESSNAATWWEKNKRLVAVAVAVLLTVTLIPFAPTGVPIIVAASAAFLGLIKRRTETT